jgi:LysR family hydrogen peroxide-inducible transcriptional activator
MNLQQLEYIIAVDTHRHFLKAAEACFVTQATLSMMIKKLEEELDVLIFDRSKQPVIPTEAGYKVITHARRILNETASLRDAVQIEKGIISGDLRIGIIPTIAPYLIPLFLKNYRSAFPKVNLHITEYTTEVIIEKLKSGQIDAGILATPLREKTIKEKPLYYEKYFLYINENEKGFDKKYVLPKHIDIERLWLLEEGHCMRSQILNFCELKKKQSQENNLHYEAGSIETLVNLVDNNYGVTVIPELAASRLGKDQVSRLRYFKDPEPVREISIVTHYEYVKERLIRTLKDTIMDIIPKEMKKQGKKNLLEI